MREPGKWESYQPSKTMWFWSVAGAIAGTMLVGFAVFGWTTAGTAQQMAYEASVDAKEELIAAVCIQNFAAEEDAAAQLAKLKEMRSWDRDEFIEEGGWTVIAGEKLPIGGAADLCAEELVAMEELPSADEDTRVVGG